MLAPKFFKEPVHPQVIFAIADGGLLALEMFSEKIGNFVHFAFLPDLKDFHPSLFLRDRQVGGKKAKRETGKVELMCLFIASITFNAAPSYYIYTYLYILGSMRPTAAGPKTKCTWGPMHVGPE